MNGLIAEAKNVVFDVGNVLLTFDPDRFLAKLLPPERAARLNAHLICTPVWSRLDEGTVGEDEVAHYSARMAGDESLWPDVMVFIRRFPDCMERLPACRLIPCLHDMGKRVYILSNYGVDTFARTERRVADVFAQVDGMVISGREKLLKPDPRIYHCLLDRYGLKAEESVFIDDTPRNIDGARAVGMRGIVYTGAHVLD